MVNTGEQRRVKDVMSRDIVSLHAGATIHEALAMMTENRVSALPIVDSRNHCVGIFTTTDLLDLTRDVDYDAHQIDVVEDNIRSFIWVIVTSTCVGENGIDMWPSPTYGSGI